MKASPSLLFLILAGVGFSAKNPASSPTPTPAPIPTPNPPIIAPYPVGGYPFKYNVGDFVLFWANATQDWDKNIPPPTDVSQLQWLLILRRDDTRTQFAFPYYRTQPYNYYATEIFGGEFSVDAYKLDNNPYVRKR